MRHILFVALRAGGGNGLPLFLSGISLHSTSFFAAFLIAERGGAKNVAKLSSKLLNKWQSMLLLLLFAASVELESFALRSSLQDRDCKLWCSAQPLCFARPASFDWLGSPSTQPTYVLPVCLGRSGWGTVPCLLLPGCS